jgi:hypothetical protein
MMRELLERADATLVRAQQYDHIERVAGRGQLVQRFVLPLSCCLPQNRTRHGQAWKLAKLKQNTFRRMWIQNGGRVLEAPLPGRPMVRCVRFSSVEPDKFSDWAKIPVDRLCCGKNRLRYLRDDRPSDAEIIQWWEPAPRGAGFCLIEVWSGEDKGAKRS